MPDCLSVHVWMLGLKTIFAVLPASHHATRAEPRFSGVQRTPPPPPIPPSKPALMPPPVCGVIEPEIPSARAIGAMRAAVKPRKRNSLPVGFKSLRIVWYLVVKWNTRYAFGAFSSRESQSHLAFNRAVGADCSRL